MKSKKALARIKAEEEAAAARQAKINRYKDYFRSPFPVVEPAELGNLTADDLRLPADDSLAERIFRTGLRPGHNSLLQTLNLLNRLDDITCATSQIAERMQEASQRLGRASGPLDVRTMQRLPVQGDPRQLPPYGTVTGRISSPHPMHVSQGDRITVEDWARLVRPLDASHLEGYRTLHGISYHFAPPIEGDDE